MRDRRRHERRKTVEVGIVEAPSERRVFCVLRDVSQTGALIEVEAPGDLPDTFRLTVEELGLDVECVVVRRNATRLGVKYDG